MIIRHKKLPDFEYQVANDEERRMAHRAIEEQLRDLEDKVTRSTGSAQPGPSAAPSPTEEAAGPPPGPSGVPAPGPAKKSNKKVLTAMANILWSYDVAALGVIHTERRRRSLVEKVLSGHSFNKFEPRVEKAAKAAGLRKEDLLLVERLGEGLAKETWFSAGAVLAAVPVEELERLQVELLRQEKKKEQEREVTERASEQ